MSIPNLIHLGIGPSSDIAHLVRLGLAASAVTVTEPTAQRLEWASESAQLHYGISRKRVIEYTTPRGYLEYSVE